MFHLASPTPLQFRVLLAVVLGAAFILLRTVRP
jgi:hypothetical protein